MPCCCGVIRRAWRGDIWVRVGFRVTAFGWMCRKVPLDRPMDVTGRLKNCREYDSIRRIFKA